MIGRRATCRDARNFTLVSRLSGRTITVMRSRALKTRD
jgi:hypothetical protein